jgi:hypothetical protein
MIRAVCRAAVNRILNTTTGEGGAGVPVFTPADVVGLSLWFDAADSESVLNSIGPDVSATDGQTVRRWKDRSENLLHANQSTGLNQPLYETAEINGNAVTRWDGANDCMEITLPATLGNTTIFMVAKSTLTADQIWISEGSKWAFYTKSGGGSAINNLFGTAAYRMDGEVKAWPGSNAQNLAFVDFCDGNTHVLSITGGTVGVWAKTTGAAKIGYVNVSLSPAADIAELIFYDGHLSGGDIDRIEDYLATKWGVTLA